MRHKRERERINGAERRRERASIDKSLERRVSRGNDTSSSYTPQPIRMSLLNLQDGRNAGAAITIPPSRMLSLLTAREYRNVFDSWMLRRGDFFYIPMQWVAAADAAAAAARLLRVQ